MRGVEQIPWLYDAYMAVFEPFGLGRWRRWLAAGARGRVLDVGTGTGRDLPLFPEGARGVALDPWLPALAVARRRSPGTPLVAGDAQALPFGPGSFDTVTSGLVFCSVADPLRGLAEVRRVLAPGGELRMLEHVRHHRPLVARLQDLVEPAWTRCAGGCHPNRDTEANVELSGFVIDRSSRKANGVMRRFIARPAEGSDA